jgi:hypothetical protein
MRGEALRPRDGVEPYGRVNALFSDRAAKDRHLYLPPGTRRPNPLDDWTARGLLIGAPPSSLAPRLPAAFDAGAPLDSRARAWLDVNGAHCHQRAGSASNSGLYLGWAERPGTALGLAKRPVAAGRGAGDAFFVIDPGHPERSIMIHRMDSTEAGVAMPELGRSVQDPAGVALIRAWIAALGA